MPQRIFLWMGLFCFFPTICSAFTINRLNGAASVSYVDFNIRGLVVPFELVRVYGSSLATNESSGWSGSFGWGWTTEFESSLVMTADRNVLLRDAAIGNTLIFRPEKEDLKATNEFYVRLKRAYFENKNNRKMSESELAQLEIPEKIMIRLKTEPKFRAEFSTRMGLKGDVPPGQVLVSNEYGNQTLRFANGHWIREKESLTQEFDSQGRLVKQVVPQGLQLVFHYSNFNKGQISEISGGSKALSLKFKWKEDRISEIVDNRGRKASYTYDNRGNLIRSVDSNGQIYEYRFDNKRFPHLMTRIEYTSESSTKQRVYRELNFNENGLVIFHRDKDGTETTYNYGRGTKDPENTLWTRTIIKVKGKASDQYDEFALKLRADGSRYLYKQESKEGNVVTNTIFSSCCGKPLQITKNGVTTNYSYYEKGPLVGLLREKLGPSERVSLDYDPRWRKISKFAQNGTSYTYSYDGRGNLTQASNSNRAQVALVYDKYGRIETMKDFDKRTIAFKYNESGRPIVIEEKGVGLIKLEYDSQGRIRKAETVPASVGARKISQDKSQEIVQRVMKSFQNLLDIIRPAGINLF